MKVTMMTPVKLATENKTNQEWLEWLRSFSKNRYVLSKDENIALRNAVINSERVAQEFFFKTLSPMNGGLAYQVLKTYKAVVDERSIASAVYREMYDEGRYSRLKNFKGECSLFAWVAMGAAQIVYADLEELGVIKKSRALSAKNTSLRLKSMKEEELLVVLDLVQEPLWHDLLIDIYVKRAAKQSLLNKYELPEELFKDTVKVAETTLKELLIEAGFIAWYRESKDDTKGKLVNLVSIALGNVSGNLDYSTSEEAFFAAENRPSDDEDLFEKFRDALQLKFPNRVSEEMWDDFVCEQAKHCGMSDRMHEVWTARYVMLEEPESVAQRMGIRRSNVDNLYSKANALLVESIRTWMETNS